MDNWLRSMHVVRLFRDVFGEQHGFDDWIVDMENDFANRVYLELFPIEIEAMNTYLEMDEDPFNAPIPLSGWRIPYEVCDVSDLNEYQQPVAELLVAARLEDECPASLAWLREDAPDVEVERNLARIAALPGPIAGVADVIRLAISRGAFDNPFLDLPGVAVAYEYMDWDTPYYWTAEDIGKLTALYKEARPVVERIQAFEAWFVANPGQADSAIIRAVHGTNLLINNPEIMNASAVWALALGEGEITDD